MMKKYIIILFITITKSISSLGSSQLGAELGGLLTTPNVDAIAVIQFAATQTALNQLATEMSSLNNPLTLTEAQIKFDNIMQNSSTLIGADFVTLIQTNQTNIDTIFSTGFKEFGRALGYYYQKAILLTQHLTYPVGVDNMGTYPSFYIGAGAGSTFANVDAVKRVAGPQGQALYTDLKALPSLGISLNGGFGITDRIDVRFSLFPPSYINLPSSRKELQNYDIAFKYSAYKLKANYCVWPGKPFSGGFSIGTFIGYTEGSLSVNTKEESMAPIQATTITSGADTPFSFLTTYDMNVTGVHNIGAQSQWKSYTIGPELKVWFNLFFIFPYFGYGVGYQSGSIDTTMTFNATARVTENVTASTGNGTSTFSSTNTHDAVYQSILKSKHKAGKILNRFILGTEIELSLSRISVEAQFDPVNRLTGIALGAGFQFH